MAKGEPILRPDQVPASVVDELVRLEAQVGASDYAALPESARLLRDFIAEHGLTTTFIRTVQNLTTAKRIDSVDLL